MSIKFNENLSKKLNYHQKSINPKTSVSTGNNNPKSLLLTSKAITKVSKKELQNERNYDDNDSVKNTIQSITDKKENTNTIKFQVSNAELNSSFEKPKNEKLIINNIEERLQEESICAIKKLENVLSILENTNIKSSPRNPKNDKYSEIKSLKEENDGLINNINSLKIEHSQILEKYNKLRLKYNSTFQKQQSTNENMKYQELNEININLQQQIKILEKKLKNLINMLNTELEEKNKFTRSLNKAASRKNLNEDKNSYLLGPSIKKNQAIENIEKEIMINKLNSLKKEIMLKDKEIAMLTQNYIEKEPVEIDSEEDLRFEESYNVTNVSDSNTQNNEYNNNLAEDIISGSDIDKNNDYIRNQKSINKPIFDISLKRFEKNKQIKHLSEIIIDDENRDNKKTNKTANSNSGVKMKMKSGDTYRKYLK